MPVARPLFTIKLDATSYAEMLNKKGLDGAAVATARRDAGFEFNDDIFTIQVGYDWRTMENEHTPFRRFIKMSDLNQAMLSATQAFRDQIDDAIEKARDACRDTFNPRTFREPAAPKVDPQDSGTKTAMAALKNAPGVAIGRDHRDPSSIDTLTDLMNQDGKPADILFIEELRAEEQQDVDDYLGGPPDAEIGPGLRKRLNALRKTYPAVDLEAMLAKAKQKGVKIYGIDTAECEPGVPKTDPSYGEKRVVVMNAFAAGVVKKALAANPGAKYMLACGEGHLNSHAGGVPGLAQILGIPGLRADATGKLLPAPDTKALRGMPGKAEQAFIDAVIAEAVEQYEAIPANDRDPKALDPVPLRRAMERLAATLVSSGELSAPGDAAGLLGKTEVKAAIAAACTANKGRAKRQAALGEAIAKGEEDKVRDLLAEDPDIVHLTNETSGRGLLHEAAKTGTPAMMDALLRAGADPNNPDTAGNTPLHEACARAGDEGQTRDGVISMLYAGADPSIPDAKGRSAVDVAVTRNDPALLGSLMEEGHGDVTEIWVKLFEKKAQEEYADSGRDPSQHEDFDVGELRKLALARYAAMKDLTRIESPQDVTEVLNVDDESDRAIDALIVRTKARKQRRRDMLAAIEGDQADAAGQLLAADPLFATLGISEGKTALDVAALGNKNQTMIGLIRGGADPNHVNSRSQTTLLEVCKTEVDKDGTTGKHKVHETAGILLDLGADPNKADRFGRTPLHYAGQWNNGALVGTLADGGADPAIKDDRGWTPLDMTQASTCKDAEKAFFDKGLAKPQPKIPAGGQSSVDLLCAATKVSNGPQDELKMRQMYEKLYAMPVMRPILDLAAASTCNDRNPPKGGLKIFASDRLTTGDMLGKPSGGSTGAYDEKVNALLLATRSDKQEGEASGTVAHELTHMTAHLVTDDERTLPFKDEAGKQEYLKAIAGDLGRMHLLSDSDPAQKFVRERISGRMASQGYANKRGMETDFADADERLLQEHIVSVPQLMATYGEDYVREKAPNLSAAFEKLSREAAETLQTDKRFAKGRAAIDPAKNAKLAQRLETNGAGPKPPEAKVLGKGEDDFNPDKIIEKLRLGLTAQLGNVKKPDLTKGASVPHSEGGFELDDKTAKAVEKRLAALKKVLATTLQPDRLPSTISSEQMPQLMAELGRAVHEAKDDKSFLKAVTLCSDTWAKKTKIDYVKDRASRDLSVRPEDMAHAVVFEAELRARAGSSDDDKWVAAALETGQSKQSKAVAELTEELSRPENKTRMEKPGELLRILPQALMAPGQGAIRVKTKPKRFGRKRDAQHVSIDVKSAKRAWVEALGKIAA